MAEKFDSSNSTDNIDRMFHNSVNNSFNLTSSAISSSLQVINPKLTLDNYKFWCSQVLFAVGAHELEDHLTGLVPYPTPLIPSNFDSSKDIADGQNKYEIRLDKFNLVDFHNSSAHTVATIRTSSTSVPSNHTQHVTLGFANVSHSLDPSLNTLGSHKLHGNYPIATGQIGQSISSSQFGQQGYPDTNSGFRSSFGNNFGSYRPHFNNFGRGRGRSNGRGKPVCQSTGPQSFYTNPSISHKIYGVFNVPSHQDQNFNRASNSSNSFTPSQQGFGHVTFPQNYSHVGSSGNVPSQALVQAHFAALTVQNTNSVTDYGHVPNSSNHGAQPIMDPTWYMDSRATDHVTSDLTQLNISKDYDGSNQLQVGSDEFLHITHTGFTSLPSILQNKCLHLKHVLCVPRITKNLLSISKFTKNNNVVVEFNVVSCVVKDKVTIATLLQGELRAGLYQLNLSPKLPSYSPSCLKSSISPQNCSYNVNLTSEPLNESHTCAINKDVVIVIHDSLNGQINSMQNATTPCTDNSTSCTKNSVSSYSSCVNKNNDVSVSVCVDTALLASDNSVSPCVNEDFIASDNSLADSNSNNTSPTSVHVVHKHNDDAMLWHMRASAPLELVHSDIWGLAPLISTEGFRYYFSRATGKQNSSTTSPFPFSHNTVPISQKQSAISPILSSSHSPTLSSTPSTIDTPSNINPSSSTSLQSPQTIPSDKVIPICSIEVDLCLSQYADKTETSDSVCNVHPMITRAKTKSKASCPIVFTAVSSPMSEPASVSEALSLLEWKQAMQIEYDALIANNT
ncbi:uncharacterized protein LOC116142926 [Pistacia vera]|uniref:uncharacterized protein LOC116142926 n=1 Tax=Pistacia vera TaxID=55513 RepID=UPI00126330EF|nr:uncharacterized protein LOC116142926 [Pistacia vera]